MEHAFFAPSVQQRLTSSVHPLSSRRATGLPIIATPRTTPLPSDTATQNLAPVTGLWCRCCFKTKALASAKLIGVITSIFPPTCAHQPAHSSTRLAASPRFSLDSATLSNFGLDDSWWLSELPRNNHACWPSDFHRGVCRGLHTLPLRWSGEYRISVGIPLTRPERHYRTWADRHNSNLLLGYGVYGFHTILLHPFTTQHNNGENGKDEHDA